MSTLQIRDIVHRALTEKVGVPSWHRRPVWWATANTGLASSLYRGMPVGLLVMWRPPAGVTVVDRSGQQRETILTWIVDGQQRISVLCHLFGHEPPWLERPWDTTLRFNLVPETFHDYCPLPWVTPTAAELAPGGRWDPHNWVHTADVLALDDDADLPRLVAGLSLTGTEPALALIRLRQLHALRERKIPVEYYED